MAVRLSRSLFDDAIVGARLLARLPSFLRHPLTTKQAREILRRRLASRESDFLAQAQRAIYANPSSPYRALLSLAGCEHGDLERLVRQEGIEGALCVLLRQGVYLTLDELKERRPLVRGSTTLSFDPIELRNPAATGHLVAQTGGSRGVPMVLPLDLAFLRDHVVNWRLVLEARGCVGGATMAWLVPGAVSLYNLLEAAGYGVPIVRWLTPVDPAAPSLHPRYWWSAQLVRLAGRLVGTSLPGPEYVPPEELRPVVRWMAQATQERGALHVITPASGAVLICQAAEAVGQDLGGVHFTVGSEPLTSARLEAIRRARATVASTYRSTESGRIGYGCLDPIASDDLHQHQDLVALVQPGDQLVGDLLPNALLVSSLRPRAPLILLNVSLGDQAVLERRSCGCPLEQLGWTTHLHTVRSFEKLTAGGATFLDVDVVGVLERELPARFGGGPTDYQLVEDESPDGRPALRLLAHPRLGPLDEAAVADAFFEAVGTGDGAARMMVLHWKAEGLLRVERHPPLLTEAGKILHLHRVRPGTGVQSRS